MAEIPEPGTNSVCEQCGRDFHCGMNDELDCWCATGFPLVLSGEPGQSCLCPDCLRRKVAAQRASTT